MATKLIIKILYDGKNEQVYGLLTEDNEILYTHCCSNKMYAYGDLYGNRKDRQEELEKRFGEIEIEDKTAMIHMLKIKPEYYDAVLSGDKKFEIRYNDRDFHVGDILRLKEWDGEDYTGREIDALVRYILKDFDAGLKDGYCIMSIDIDTMLLEQPTNEEVVHCKDCEKRGSYKNCPIGKASEGAIYDDWYCADGVRRA